MRREIRFAAASLPRRASLALAGWSVPEALPTAISGLAIARAVDSGFLAGRPAVGLAWLAGIMVAAGVGAVGSRQVWRRLGDLVEPFRDDLVRRVVGGALRHGVAGRPDDGAVARLTRQVELARDTYAGLIMLLRSFVVTVIGVVLGLLSIAPVIALLALPPFVLGFGAFLATLGMSAARLRASARAEERLAATAGAVLAGTRDMVACGAEEHAAGMVAGPIEEQAAAERALARVAVLRMLCFAVGGWGPLVVLLAAGPWLASRGLTAGAIMGGLTYVLVGLQPALRTVTAGLGSSGLRLVVLLGRILDASAAPATRAPSTAATAGNDLILRDVTFAYGPHSEPVLRDLNLAVPAGDHVAVVGPSGIGKSTLANLLCGLLRPDEGTVRLGGIPVTDLPPDRLAGARVLIPQEAYVFAGTVWDNLTYLRPTATAAEVDRAMAAVGAEDLVARLGGCSAELLPAELSAGERQLLALVRAYLSPAPVVVLDEATCHLDPVAEQRAEEAFAERDGTLIVIAHRLSSALRAGRVLVLDGVHATIGDHLTLLSTSPLYQELLGHWHARPEPAKTGAVAAPGESSDGVPSIEALTDPVQIANRAAADELLGHRHRDAGFLSLPQQHPSDRLPLPASPGPGDPPPHDRGWVSVEPDMTSETVKPPEPLGGQPAPQPDRGRLTGRQVVRLAAVAIVIVLLGGAAGFGGALLWPPMYAARAEILYPTNEEQPTGSLREDPKLSTQVALLESRAVLGPVAAGEGRPAEELEENVTVEVLEGSELIRVEVRDTSGEVAGRSVQAILERYLDVYQMQRRSPVRQYLERELEDVRNRTETARGELLQLRAEAAAGLARDVEISTAEDDLQPLIAREQEVLRQLDEINIASLAAPNAEVLTPPYVMAEPVSPRPQVTAAIGALTALIIAACVVTLTARRWTKDRGRSA